MRGKRLLRIAAIGLGIGAITGCGGAAFVGSSTLAISSMPPTTTTANPTASVRYCQRLPDGRWVTNDSAFSTTPCVPDPSYATGDEEADGSGVIPRCFGCSPSDWDRAETRAEQRSAGVDGAAAASTSPSDLPTAADGTVAHACAQDAEDGLCGCVTGQLAQQVPSDQMGALPADDPRVRAALQSCQQ
jgi:hypothetical protein